MRTLAGVQREDGGIEGKVNFMVQWSRLAFEIVFLAECKTHKTVWKKKELNTSPPFLPLKSYSLSFKPL